MKYAIAIGGRLIFSQYSSRVIQPSHIPQADSRMYPLLQPLDFPYSGRSLEPTLYSILMPQTTSDPYPGDV